MKYNVFLTSSFKRDYKKISRQGYAKDVDAVIDKLENGIPLDAKYHDHKLTGNMDGFRECHVLPDLLLVYKKDKEKLLLTCLRVGSHSDLFKK